MEWRQWRVVGDPVLHIELRRWADVLVVAPLSANSLAKMANGMADNLLTCVVRAWDFAKPLLVAPAMNTAMWASPFTARHLDTLTQLGRSNSSGNGGGGGSSNSSGATASRGDGAGSENGISSTVVVVAPISKRLACGDEGTGAMAAPETIAAACSAALQRAGALPQGPQQPPHEPEENARRSQGAGAMPAGEAAAPAVAAGAADGVAAAAAAEATPGLPRNGTTGRGGTSIGHLDSAPGQAADGGAGWAPPEGRTDGSAEPDGAGMGTAVGRQGEGLEPRPRGGRGSGSGGAPSNSAHTAREYSDTWMRR
ncbi:hypothetical protein HYH02_010286 [Chlamydomonas schloesseri]|uniref:phosphopantothenoylcysteine decarboxylase n=1 Tax=Chlamydomonas schloesseri TaxID=2026947 RepID=A0A835W7N2_9CHLO|nr:hypothetical protein HYH02_010286 [Chlamydomonas schloesseri]|eukprot:KAG2440398.1 hypothetical protein HYH02_010286 [Chlamydomonas schloesseri]